MNLDKVLELMREKDIKYVRFEQTDINGVARSKTIPARHFKEKVTGGLNFRLGHLGMDVKATIISGSGYNEEIGFADSVMFADLDTFQVIPWLENMGRILIEPTFRGEYVSGHPRVLARRQLDKLKEMGYSLLSAHEHEFYVVDKETREPLNDDSNIRATIRLAPLEKFVKQVMDDLPEVGVDVEAVESEYGPGQIEISYKPAFGIRAADNAHTYKTSIKEIALRHGLMASFMSKPYLNKPGSSCHFCHSLWDAEEKEPVLHDAGSPIGLSKVAQHWMAGILAHARAIQVLMAPTVNCMKRVKPWMSCPVNVTWGIDNRSCLLRVKVKGDKGTYLENRAGAAGCNPYLALAATVAAGMDGIANEYKLPPQVSGMAYVADDLPPKTSALPTNMEDALEALMSDQVIREALGNDFIKCFSAVKIHEAKMERKALAEGEKNCDFDYYFEYL
ncbi:lengsin-like [Diadema antillarum]|uniref:lengsin-like n=1 Tax=Diadema antillarum TaxID=105358 RepID=UPI003A8B4301